MFKFDIANIIPGALFLFCLFFIYFFWGGGGGGREGGLKIIHGRSFPFQKLAPKRSRAYTRWGLLSEFYGTSQILACQARGLGVSLSIPSFYLGVLHLGGRGDWFVYEFFFLTGQ